MLKCCVLGGAELKSFEIPRDFILELEEFSQENGLLSSVRKRLRPLLESEIRQAHGSHAKFRGRKTRPTRALKDRIQAYLLKKNWCAWRELTLGADAADDLLDKTFNSWAVIRWGSDLLAGY